MDFQLGKTFTEMVSLPVRKLFAAKMSQYNNIVIIRAAIDVEKNQCTDFALIGRMLLFLCADDLKQVIEKDLNQPNILATPWIYCNMNFAKAEVLEVLQKSTLISNQPFVDVAMMEDSEVKLLVPLILVLLPDFVQIVENSSKRPRVSAAQHRVAFWDKRNNIFEFGIVTSRKNDVLTYDTVYHATEAHTHEDDVCVPDWTVIKKRGVQRNASKVIDWEECALYVTKNNHKKCKQVILRKDCRSTSTSSS